MNWVNSPFPITLGRSNSLATFGKLSLCFLISIGMALIIGCEFETDIKDLSKKPLMISWVISDKQILNTQQVARLTANVEYSDGDGSDGDDSELLYDWSASEGEIYENGTHATYVAPEKCGTFKITFK